MRKYFVHQLKKNLLPLAYLTLFCIVMYVIPIWVENYSYWNDNPNPVYTPDFNFFRYSPNLYYENISVALGIISVFIPILLLSYKMNRRSTDMYYSLPMGKTKILVVNLLVGLVLMYASYTVAYWIGFLAIVAKVQRMHLIFYLYLYLASIIPAFISYAVTAFIYTRANTVVDGIISVAAALCVSFLAISAVDQICSNFRLYGYSLDETAFIPFSALSSVTTKLGGGIIGGNVPSRWFTSSESYRRSSDICALVGALLWTVLSIGATVGLILTEKDCKAENCGQRSDSIFCYKTLIPIYAALLSVIACAYEVDFVFLCAIAFGMFVACIIYKRTVKIGWKFAVVVAACVIGGVLFAVITKAIADYSNVQPLTAWLFV